jgi:hypothetical protein
MSVDQVLRVAQRLPSELPSASSPADSRFGSVAPLAVDVTAANSTPAADLDDTEITYSPQRPARRRRAASPWPTAFAIVIAFTVAAGATLAGLAWTGGLSPIAIAKEAPAAVLAAPAEAPPEPRPAVVIAPTIVVENPPPMAPYLDPDTTSAGGTAASGTPKASNVPREREPNRPPASQGSSRVSSRSSSPPGAHESRDPKDGTLLRERELRDVRDAKELAAALQSRQAASAQPPGAQATATAAPAPTTGVVRVPVSDSILAIVVDGSYRRVHDGAVIVSCGPHSIRFGSGLATDVDVPCGGSVSLR